MLTFVYKSNNKFSVTVKDDTGAFVNNATVTLSILDGSGTPITSAGITWPVTMTATGANGLYTWEADSALAVINNQKYRAEITVTSTGGVKAYSLVDFKVTTDIT